MIHDGYKYIEQVYQTGPGNFFLVMNGETVEADTHHLADGGLLVTFEGSSLTTYFREEVGGYRINIDNMSDFFEKEKDPSVLRSPTTG